MADSSIYVYNCSRITKLQKITSVIDNSYALSLAVHPLKPYVLLGWKILDWDKGWTYAGRINNPYTIRHAVFNPKDPNSCACVSENAVRVWGSFDSRDADYIMYGHCQEKLGCLDFFTRDDGHYLITGSDQCAAKIWDLQKRECIHTMEAMSPVTCVLSFPDRPYLVTGSGDGTVQLWSSTDFRLEKTANLCSGDSIVGLVCLMGSRRVVIGQEHAITIMEIDDEESVASKGNH